MDVTLLVYVDVTGEAIEGCEMNVKTQMGAEAEQKALAASFTGGSRDVKEVAKNIPNNIPSDDLGAFDSPVRGKDAATRWPKATRVGRREDMSPDGTLIVGLDNDNDVYIEVSGNRHGEWQSAAVEFCNGGGGGGRSSRTRAALIALMVAIEADNEEYPHKAFPGAAQSSKGASQGVQG